MQRFLILALIGILLFSCKSSQKIEIKNPVITQMEYDADIFDAVEFGDLNTVKLYWRDHINIDWQDENGMDLIMLACRYGHADIIEFLLKFNPDLSKKNKSGQTALDLAIKSNKEQAIFLIKNALNEN